MKAGFENFNPVDKDQSTLRRINSTLIAFLVCCLTFPSIIRAQSGDHGLSHLTIYNAGVAEFLEERTVELQPGLNTIEWRSLIPKAYIRTVHMLAESAEVVRQDVTYDGSAGEQRKIAGPAPLDSESRSGAGGAPTGRLSRSQYLLAERLRAGT
jgi:hypothetical protein